MRRSCWLAALLLVLTARRAQALDDNADGMSDVWAWRYSISPAQANADADGDGEANLREARAGTNPTNATSNSRLSISPSPDISDLRWLGIGLRRYELETATNLVAWGSLGNVVTGSGSMVLFSNAPVDGSVRFFHFGILPDFDQDGDLLDDWEEGLLGTSPVSIDSDFDAMPDGWEFRHGLAALVDDAGGDPDGDGVNNFAEYQQGRDPSKGAMADTNGFVALVVYTLLE